jgi:hypothetical protein
MDGAARGYFSNTPVLWAAEGQVCRLHIKRPHSRLVAACSGRIGEHVTRMDLGNICGRLPSRVHSTVGDRETGGRVPEPSVREHNCGTIRCLTHPSIQVLQMAGWHRTDPDPAIRKGSLPRAASALAAFLLTTYSATIDPATRTENEDQN